MERGGAPLAAAVRFCSCAFMAPRDVSGTVLPSIVSPLLFRVGSCRFLRRLPKLFLAPAAPLQMLRGRTPMNVNSLESETSRR